MQEKRALFPLLLAGLAGVLTVATSLILRAACQTGRNICGWIFSLEAFTPALIIELALLTHFVHQPIGAKH